MGTNYYMFDNVCEHCQKGLNKRHIGKSSGGWCFALHVYPNEDINTLEAWKKILDKPDILIKDEYGDIIQKEELYVIIENRAGINDFKNIPFNYDSWEQFHKQNYSKPGPNGLIRHKLHGGLCIGNGKGTYDYLTGNFS